MRGCNCGTVHEDAHAPGCSGFAVEYHRLTADNALLRADAARLREALEKIEARCARISEETLEVFQLRHELREVRVTARAALATDGEGT